MRERGSGQRINNDCLRFADGVDIPARGSRTDTAFMAALYRRYRGDREGNLFRSRGFMYIFADEVGPGNSPNQVCHTAGALTAGFAGALRPKSSPGTYKQYLDFTLKEFNGRERNIEFPDGVMIERAQTASQQADTGLNNVAAPLGFAPGFGALSRRQLGEAIRRIVCASQQAVRTPRGRYNTARLL